MARRRARPAIPPSSRYSSEFRTGRWTDVYALGALAYRLISGHAPIDALTRNAQDIMKPAREVGADKYHRSLLQAIDWALKVHPLERPQNLAQWKDALLGLRDTVVVGAASPATVPITATMIRKFSELREKKKTLPATPVSPVAPVAPVPIPPRRGGANATPIPPPEPETPLPKAAAPPPPAKPVPAAPRPVPVVPKPAPIASPPRPATRPIAPTIAPPKPAVPPLVAPARRTPVRPSTPPPAQSSSALSVVAALIVLILAVGYWWYTDTRRAQAPAASGIPPPVQQAAPAPGATAPVLPPQTVPPVPTAEPSAQPIAAPSLAPEDSAVQTPPQRTRDPEAPAGADAQKQLVAELRTKLAGNWTQESTYVAMVPGSDCYASIARSWSIRLDGATDQGRALAGSFTTGVRAKSAERSDCRQFDDQITVAGTLSARPLSATMLQVEAAPLSCTGDCDPIADVFNYRTLGRRYRFAISSEADRMTFSEGEVDFEVSRPR